MSRAGDGGAHASREERRHGEKNAVRHGFRREKPRADEKRTGGCAGERAHREGREKEAPGDAAPEAHESEERFPQQKQEQDGQRRRHGRDRVDEAVAAAREKRAGERHEARAGEREGDAQGGPAETGQAVEPARPEKPPVEDSRRRAAHRAEKKHIWQMGQGQRRQPFEEKKRARPEEEAHHARRGHRRGHDGEDHRGAHVMMERLQREEHPRERRVEDGGKPRRRAARHEAALLPAAARGETARSLGRRRADLHRRPRVAEGQPRADGERPAENLHEEHPRPAHAQRPLQDALHLGNAASRRHGLPPAERGQHERDPRQRRRPERVFGRRERRRGETRPQPLRLRDERAVERHRQARREPRRRAPAEEAEPRRPRAPGKIRRSVRLSHTASMEKTAPGRAVSFIM